MFQYLDYDYRYKRHEGPFLIVKRKAVIFVSYNLYVPQWNHVYCIFLNEKYVNHWERVTDLWSSHWLESKYGQQDLYEKLNDLCRETRDSKDLYLLVGQVLEFCKNNFTPDPLGGWSFPTQETT